MGGASQNPRSGRAPDHPVDRSREAWRGGPQPQLSRLLAGCQVREFTEQHARTVGRVLGETGAADIVDASVVVIAQRFNEEILTSDPDDLEPIAGVLGRPRVTIRSLDNLGRH